jgi:hypothetical protein
MASDLVAQLDSMTTTLDAAVGVTAYWRADLNPNALPTTAYVALDLVGGGTSGGGFGDLDYSFSDLLVQMTSWSPVSFGDAATKGEAALVAIRAAGWDMASAPTLEAEGGWRGVRTDVRLTAGVDALT